MSKKLKSPRVVAAEKAEKPKCTDCGRTDGALVPAPGLEPPWLCPACLQQRINKYAYMTQADEDLNDHLVGGGKLS